MKIAAPASSFDDFDGDDNIRSIQRLNIKLGRKRFGPIDSSIEAAIRSIADLSRLERMGDAILVVKNWQELLATA
jgi:hypothetical protein